MAVSFSTIYEHLRKAYQSNFDIEEYDQREDGLKAFASMHLTESQCMIFEEFKMWTASSDEYNYIFYIPKLTKELAQRCIDYSYNDGFPRIQLEHVSFKQQHMCTRLVCMVICDEADPDAIKLIQKCRIYKSFQFSLKGWMEMHTVLCDLNREKIYHNRYGRETGRFLKKLYDYSKTHTE